MNDMYTKDKVIKDGISTMKSLLIIFSAHDRMDKTRECLYSLDDIRYDIRYIAVDDGSVDKTAEMLRDFAREKDRNVDILNGDGRLYWAGGMRKGMKYVLSKGIESDYVLLVNDDVKFYENAIRKMTDTADANPGFCIVGATCDKNGTGTYGGFRYNSHSVKETSIDMDDPDRSCDVANMNAFLMPYDVFCRIGMFDVHYTHKMADFDYCFELNRNGIGVLVTDYYVGVCEKRTIKSTWEDRDISRFERIRLKEDPKGLPAKEWFYFLRKNFGLKHAVWHSITPYLRILMGK